MCDLGIAPEVGYASGKQRVIRGRSAVTGVGVPKSVGEVKMQRRSLRLYRRPSLVRHIEHAVRQAILVVVRVGHLAQSRSIQILDERQLLVMALR